MPEEISEVIRIISASQMTEVYYWLTTVAMEAEAIVAGFRVYIVLSPKACKIINIFHLTLGIVYSYSDLTLLLCLHALLGARSMYLAPIMATYMGLTLGVTLIQISYSEEISRTVSLSEFDRELGYACTWAGNISTASANKHVIAGYISLTKALCIFALVLFIFLVRYRRQAGTFKLFHVLRRDSVIVTRSAVSNSTQCGSGWFISTNNILDGFNRAVVPILANRLLLNMWRTQDPEVRKTVSSILFDPPRPGEDSEDDEDEFADRPVELVRYEGLGRRRAPAREANEGNLQGGAGAKQAVENGDAHYSFPYPTSWARFRDSSGTETVRLGRLVVVTATYDGGANRQSIKTSREMHDSLAGDGTR
ncbi:hypothetical protein DFP72DRAFT_851976 [Ephemerocybe angulata]|uniref:Uncharacterized protein n=1 Tax=Ephemerocybe angulata TaxID=980116 RepID=A0A8H6HMY6_9AGAR|nr:hypothetical protein DFP72DRAFT_851976 [Tulosesus angulatus]